MFSPIEQSNLVSSENGRIPEGLSIEDRQIVANVLSRPVKFVYNRKFRYKSQVDKFSAIKVDLTEAKDFWNRSLNKSIELTKLSSKDLAKWLFTTGEEKSYFLKYNYARREVAILASGELTIQQARALIKWWKIAQSLREDIAVANLGLLFKVASRYKIWSHPDAEDILSELYIALLRAVDGFDVGRGWKFSTYGWTTITKAVWWATGKSAKYYKRFVPTDLTKHKDPGYTPNADERFGVENLRKVLHENEAHLSTNEKHILYARYFKGWTLEETGQSMKLTRERIRQLQKKALRKLKIVMTEKEEELNSAG